jgi:hypothetical protein
MGYTKSGDPFVGPVQGDNLEGQFVAAGFSGHGMPRAFSWCVHALESRCAIVVRTHENLWGTFSVSSAQVVAEMISANMRGTEWSCPTWLPRHYLTTESAVAAREAKKTGASCFIS